MGMEGSRAVKTGMHKNQLGSDLLVTASHVGLIAPESPNPSYLRSMKRIRWSFFTSILTSELDFVRLEKRIQYELKV